MSHLPISGTCVAGWEQVRDALHTNFAAGEEVGCGVAVYHKGDLVVDLVAGWTDRAKTKEYGANDLQLVFSTTKGITATAVAICVERGLLDYALPVAHYWPEFAQNGKGNITVAQLLSHQAGLYTVNKPMEVTEILHWNTITAELAAMAPLWEPGTEHGYHALTFGWLAGELIRRVDGRGVGQFIQEEIAAPLDVELYVGLPEALEHRVVPLLMGQGHEKPKGPETEEAKKTRELLEQFMGPNTPGGKALSLSGSWTGEGLMNRSDVLRAEIPAANGVTNARSLAAMYCALQHPVNGVQLVSSAMREAAFAVQTPKNEPDTCLIGPTSFAMGYMAASDFTPYVGGGACGHPGFGGSVAFLQPQRQLAFGYVMNKLADNLAGDTRAKTLMDAAARCADAL
ncbi:MAG: serine hydrolase domain-containing protein [Actinomycetes bacterium]